MNSPALLAEAESLAPANAADLANRGDAYRRSGQGHLAIVTLQRAVALQPDLVGAQLNLALALAEQGELDAAVRCMQQAAVLRPKDAALQHRFALLLLDAGHETRACEVMRSVLDLDLQHAEAWLDFGLTLAQTGKGREADGVRDALLKLDAVLPRRVHEAGSLALSALRFDLASAELRRARLLSPDNGHVLGELASCMLSSGRVAPALDLYREALRLRPDDAALHSNFTYLRTFDATATDWELLADARRWAERFARPSNRPTAPRRNDPSADRRLRVGYVSPDFCFHSISFFTIPLFANHNHDAVEIVCYSGTRQPDSMTERVRALADHWREVAALDDEHLAQLVRDDQVDILVDLSLHAVGNRLRTFAMKPAPVQVTWLAYPGTTGLDTIDYRITDPHFDPPEVDPDRYSEASFRLPATYWCYDPLEARIEINALPAGTNQGVTFASFNTYSKVNEGVLELWARCLAAVRGSRLVLTAPRGEGRHRAREIFSRAGIDSARVEFIDRRPRLEYLKLHHQVDILLDTFPVAGGLTSLEALWMGVPVITLAGKRLSSRGGASLNANLDLHELVAKTPDEYVSIATRLASDLPRLGSLRASLRERLRASPLMDARRFAHDMESAYRSMWLARHP